MASVPGFILSVRDTLRLRKSALLWIGLPCSSFLGRINTHIMNLTEMLMYYVLLYYDVSAALPPAPRSKVYMDVYRDYPAPHLCLG